MTDTFQERLYGTAKKACDLWGPAAQFSMAKGEAAEFIAALCDLERRRKTPRDVLGEIADVYITIASVRVILKLTPEQVKEAMEAKLSRLESLIAAETSLPAVQGGR